MLGSTEALAHSGAAADGKCGSFPGNPQPKGCCWCHTFSLPCSFYCCLLAEMVCEPAKCALIQSSVEVSARSLPTLSNTSCLCALWALGSGDEVPNRRKAAAASLASIGSFHQVLAMFATLHFPLQTLLIYGSSENSYSGGLVRQAQS